MKLKNLLLLAASSALLASCGGGSASSASSSAASSSASSASSAASSVVSSEASSEVSSESSEVTETIYYLVGSFNSWKPTEGYEFTKSEEQIEEKDQYTLSVTLTAGDTLKVTDSNNKWYPDGMGNDYNVTANGLYTVYFCPLGGIADWYSGYFKLVLEEEGGESINITLDVTITNFDSDQMQNPQFVYYTGEESAEAEDTYVSGFVADEAEAGHFTKVIALAEPVTIRGYIALWLDVDPWDKYSLWGGEDQARYVLEVEQSGVLAVSGEIALDTDGGAVGTWAFTPSN